jgi:hypothetical protein
MPMPLAVAVVPLHVLRQVSAPESEGIYSSLICHQASHRKLSPEP